MDPDIAVEFFLLEPTGDEIIAAHEQDVTFEGRPEA